ncbi:MAG: GTPase HflX, partial [Treponema sp.]|nr:GTPase HflX [Treponema sp.]
ILQIKKELSQVAVNRQTQRRQRERTAVATCALVGYTNAGKSSLLNALTGADAFVEDKLFATLDPTTRKFAISEASQVLLTDTVGFISNLPHTLIDAFRSTLEEAALADLLLVVVDSSDEKAVRQYEQVLEVLKEINADGIPKMVVLNKIDKIRDDLVLLSNLESNFPGAVHVCAKTGEGFETLIAGMTENLLGSLAKYLVPMDRPDLVEVVRKNGTIESEEWLEDGVHLLARIPGHVDSDGKFSTKTLALLKPYQVD